MRLIDDKAPEEIIPLTIDFANLVDSIDSVVVDVSVKNGTDANPTSLLYGGAQISGTEVLQLIQNGLDDVIYLIKMTITNGDTKFTEGVYLPVKDLN